jgi:large subunit ribosomal protein L18
VRIRKKVFGTAAKPRLSVFKSLSHIYAQLIDDASGKTLMTASTAEKAVKTGLKHGGNVEAARKVGASIAERALEKNIKDVVFDRGGYQYHGCVKALADAAREKGLSF